MLTFIQFISEGSSGQKALNRKRIAAGKGGPSRWTSDIGHRMVYKSSMSLLRKNAKKNIKEGSSNSLKIGKALVAAAGIGAAGLLGHDMMKTKYPKITRSKQVDNVPQNQKDVNDELRIMRNKK